MNTDEYEGYATEIVNALAAIPSEGIPNTRLKWTDRIRDVVRKIGIKHDFHVCPSDEGGDERQWLYDLVWYRNNKETNTLEMVPLVLESEWSMDDYEIRYDFEKLLVANSPLKVMVCQSHADTVEKNFNKLESGINVYKSEITSIYILACYSPDGSRVKIRTSKKEPHKAIELMTI